MKERGARERDKTVCECMCACARQPTVKPPLSATGYVGGSSLSEKISVILKKKISNLIFPDYFITAEPVSNYLKNRCFFLINKKGNIVYL